jgi:syntaxin 5
MPKDRTSEFHSTLASIRSRQAVPSGSTTSKSQAKEARQPLLLNSNGASGSGSGSDGPHILRAPGASGVGPKADSKKLSEFGRMAGGIAKDINATTAKLGKLAQCMSIPNIE